MSASLEILSGVVRVGDSHEKYGDPYDYAVAFCSADGKHAVIKALVSDGDFSQTYARQIIRKIKSYGLIPIWERRK